MRPGQLFVALGIGLTLAVGAAEPASAQDPAPQTQAQATAPPTPGDPYERFNRRVFAGSNQLDEHVLLPLARLYQALTPGFIGKAIHNVVTNLSEPLVIANDILQARLKDAGRDMLRLTSNSLVGLGGLIDVATPAGLPQHDNDFGVTLGVWGVRPGPYLFLPVLGPSTVRDAIGEGVELVADPLNYVRFPGRLTLQVTTTVVGGLDTRIRAQGDMEALLSTAADPYATLRSVYLQSREAQVRGEGAVPVLPEMDDPGASAPAPAPTAAPGPSSEATPPPADQFAQAGDDPDRPIMTARPCDREGATQLAALD